MTRRKEKIPNFSNYEIDRDFVIYDKKNNKTIKFKKNVDFIILKNDNNVSTKVDVEFLKRFAIENIKCETKKLEEKDFKSFFKNKIFSYFPISIDDIICTDSK